MGRYHLHVHRADAVIDDDEGRELESLGDALQEALSTMREILAEEVMSGTLDLCGCVVITDEADSALLVVPFTKAVEVRAGFR